MAVSTSVVIPCFNHGTYLPEAVESVTRHGRDDVEIIVVDDGSTDQTTLAEMAKLRDAGIQVLHQENKGLGAARNAGIRVARGEFIVPLDSDNRLTESYFIDGVRILESDSSIGVVYGDAAYFGNRTGLWKVLDFDLRALTKENFIDACAIYRKAVWNAIGGYDENMPWMGLEDWDFWLRTAVGGWSFHHLDKIAFDYRVRANSMLTETDKHYAELINYIFAKRHNQAAALIRELSADAEEFRRIASTPGWRVGRAVLAFIQRVKRRIVDCCRISKV